MPPIARKLVTNEAMQVIAVQIDYADWLKIEPLFNGLSTAEKTTAFDCFTSVKSLNEGPQFKTRQLTPAQLVTRQHSPQSVTERLKAHPLFTNEIDFDTPLELEWNETNNL